MSEFIRNFREEKIEKLKKEDLFNQKLLGDITKHNINTVFPALRNDYISFYYKGGGLFEYDGKFTTHHNYGVVPKKIKEYISEEDLINKVKIETSFVNAYEKIKKRCDVYGTTEAYGVSRLYKYNATNQASDIVLLDTEIAFTNKKTQNRIDLLLYNKVTKTLLFVEAKHFSNNKLWAKKNAKPKVVNQIKKYTEEIKNKEETIIKQYKDYIKQINILLKLDPPLPEPKHLHNDVGLLIFGYDINQKNKIQTLLIDDNSLKDIPYYAIGNISNIKIENLYNSIESNDGVWEHENETFIKIHRGTDQIGGTVTEIKSKEGRIFIDFGSQLQGAENITNLEIDGLTDEVADSTLLLTHYHGDHIEEIHRVLDDVPVYIGEIAKDISITLCDTLIKADIDNKDEQIKKRDVLQRAENYVNKKSFDVEDIKITPYKVDHSAFDSYMLLIEVEGKKILHTGDYRFHGHQGDKLMKNIEEIGTIDYLITEGTTLSREDIPDNILTQEEYSEKLKSIFKEHKKVAVLCSSTNIDHLASVQKALSNEKIILCDAYQKSILDVVTKHQKESNQDLPDIYKFEDENISLFNYSKNKDKPIQEEYCALIRKAKQPYFIMNEEFNQDIYLVYSLWTGYLKGKHVDPKMKKLQDLYGDRFIKLHTSGHVYKEDLQKMIDILKPEKIIPIHTENSNAFNDIAGGRKVLVLKDGQEIKI